MVGYKYKGTKFTPAEYWKSNFKSVKEALLLAEVYVYEYDTERRNPQTLYSLFSDLEENKEGSQLLQRFAGLRE